MSSNISQNWLHELDNMLALFGHRNWIVVSDAAYPDQSAPGIRTILADGDPFDAVAAVLHRIDSSRHVRANVIIDAELRDLTEEDAPGVADYRKRLDALLESQTVTELLHEEVIARLDAAGQTFRVLVVKTACTTPYTTVFIELDCGYWSADAESRLRAKMPATS